MARMGMRESDGLPRIVCRVDAADRGGRPRSTPTVDGASRRPSGFRGRSLLPLQSACSCGGAAEQGGPALACFRFDDFELHTGERKLLLSGQPCALGSRAFDVLTALLEHRNRVVGKGELLELAWPGLIVEENNLSVQISALRKLLGNDAIATVPSRGYKFSRPCEVHVDGEVGTPLMSRSQDSAADAGIAYRHAALVWIEPPPAARGSAKAPTDDAASIDWQDLRRVFIEAGLAAFAGELKHSTHGQTVLVFASAIDALAYCLDLDERVALARTRGDARAVALRMVVMPQQRPADSKPGTAESPFLRALLESGDAIEGVFVDDAVRRIAGQRLAAAFLPLSPATLGRTGSGHPGWRVERRSVDRQLAMPSPHLLWNHRPTLAVLPLLSEARQEDAYFGDGITEEIVTALSLHRSFFVIARTSTLQFRDPSTAVERAAAELGVRYVITGTVRRIANRLRIHVELTDTEANIVIWSERFDGNDDDLFNFQSDIAARVAAAIDPQVRHAEQQRIRSKPTQSFGAYDCVLRGLSLLYGVYAGDFDAAGKYFLRALELDPGYAQAHGQMARWYSLRAGDGRADATAADRMAAEFHAQQAVTLDPRDAWCLAVAGHIQSFLRKRFAVAMDLFDQALAINPNCALAWARSGTTLAYLGQGEAALERVRNAMRLSPLDPLAFYFHTTSGMASLVLGRHDEAIAWFSRARTRNPRYRAPMRMLIAAHSLCGNSQEAVELAKAFMLEEPNFRISAFASWYPMQMPHLGKVLEGLRAAGLPD